ncbi:YbaY family lipoprotein [Photobacterium sp.]|uniref:YbaY family lipoprotein n=1 Tax=Photobacterium sp. TaxID=660 RepID=UPI00299DFBE0|nr:YbaY family lipoprotein [Photobacterium sp.]MDX1302301.1 YbaY family lipoprotein [Photobacterium sp.]
MKQIIALMFALVVALVITACTNLIQTDTDMSSVEGSLTYAEPVALPDDARITVTLADVSKMDAAAEVISSQSFIADGKQVPFIFQLDYKLDEVKPNHTYTVSARIEINGKLIFITDTANPVITDPGATNKLNLMLVKVK